MPENICSEIVDTNVNNSHKEIPFGVSLQENQFSEYQFDNTHKEWRGMHHNSCEIFKVPFVRISFVSFNSCDDVGPLKLPVEWNNKKIETPRQLRSMHGERMEPLVVMTQTGEQKTDPGYMETPVTFH